MVVFGKKETKLRYQIFVPPVQEFTTFKFSHALFRGGKRA
jgi:hypothetical protein